MYATVVYYIVVAEDVTDIYLITYTTSEEEEEEDSNICTACQNGDENNVGRYCLDRVIGDRTWCGTVNDIDVINFVQEHDKEIAITFETARNKNEVIKYYFEIEVEFYHRNGLENADVQYTTARFNIPPMTLGFVTVHDN